MDLPLAGLSERTEDIEPNLAYELAAATRALGVRITMSKEARDHFLEFAIGRDASWRGSFRDLNAAITRMATLAPGGRIGVPRRRRGDRSAARVVETSWRSRGRRHRERARRGGRGGDRSLRPRSARLCAARVQGVAIALGGWRALFSASRAKKASVNDADRLRKYLLRFGLSWDELARPGE